MKDNKFSERFSFLRIWFLARNGWHVCFSFQLLFSISFFGLPLLFYPLIEKSCHLSHCCSQQQEQVEVFMLVEQCSWGVVKQRRQFDVSTSPQWTKKLHPQSWEVDNCRRHSSGSQSVRGQHVDAGGGFSFVFDFIPAHSTQIQTDKEKAGVTAYLRHDHTVAACEKSSEHWSFIFCELVHVCVFIVS